MLIDKIHAETGVEIRALIEIARSANHLYKEYSIPKRSEGFRTIHHPTPRLKLVQRWIANRVISKLPISDAATAYVRGKSLKHNAGPHLGSSYILKMDFSNFFPSLKQEDLYEILQKQGYKSFDIEFINKICFLDGALTIGAPSSPSISNAIMFDLDNQISSYCQEERMRFTRYADDLTISSNSRDQLLEAIEKITFIVQSKRSPSIKINTKKTSLIGSGSHQRVTGLTLATSGKLSVGREVKRRLRIQSHHYDLKKMPEEDEPTYFGWLAFVQSVEPDFVEKILSRYPRVAKHFGKQNEP